MSPRDKDRRKISGRVIGAAAAGAGLLIISIGALISNIGSGSDTPSPGAGVVRLELIAARDIGALSDRDTWCSGAAHCWVFQQSSGDATDYGSAPGGWHITPTNSPRVGSLTSIPISDASGWVDYTTEKASWFDGAGSPYFAESGVSGPVGGDALSVTFIAQMPTGFTSNRYLIFHSDGSKGYIFGTNTGKWRVVLIGASTKSVLSTSTYGDGAWHCVTAVGDSTPADSAAFFVDGSDDTAAAKDLAVGDWQPVSQQFRVSYIVAGNKWPGGISRIRMDYGALTLAQHRELCGDLWQAPAGGRSDNKPLASDDTWTQTAGAGCYPTGDSTAVCVPGGLMPYHIVDSARGPAWPPQQALTNELLYSTAIDCTNWSCVGSATATFGAVAPDGSATATLLAVSVGANHVEQDLVAAFTVDASPLHLGFWFRCTTGTVHPHGSNDGALGDWDIDCSCVAGAWTYLHADHACVTVNIPFNADSSGNSGLHFDGSSLVNGTVWAPTLTEQRAWSRVVIPTAAAAVAMGNPIWAINNTSTNYYRAGDTVTQSLTTYDGTCFAVPGTDILLAGSPTCSGSWYGLKVQK